MIKPGKLTRLYLFFAMLNMAAINVLNAQSVSNAGTEFWSVFPTHVPVNQQSLANLTVFITGNQASSGTVTVGTFSQKFTVTANLVTTVPIPRSIAYINSIEGNSVLTNRAIHIVVDPGQPKVVVYSHIFAGKRSAATLILPKEALSQRYYSMNYAEYDPSFPEGQNFIIVIATQPNTKIHLKQGNVDLVAGGITLPNVNDVYEYLSYKDLSGTSISVDTVTSGCNSFAAFSGSSGDIIATPTCNPTSLDPLFQQLYPIESWGVHYGFVPFSMVSPNFTGPVRTAGQYVRVVAKDNNTVVSINGAVVSTLNSGQFYTTPAPLTTPSYITGSKPISVAQYALTEVCSNIIPDNSGFAQDYSDPDMVILNPIEYNIKNITVYSSTLEAIAEEYINVLIKTSAAASFKINGVAPTGTFTPMATLPGYSYLQLDLTRLNTGGTKSFNLTASDGFNAIAYGFGNVESYSYSAGTNLASSQSVSTIKAATGLAIDSACVNDNFFFKLVLPFKSSKIDWKMDVNEADIIQTNPAFTVDSTNGVLSYVYLLAKTPAYKIIGSHTYKIVADYPTTTGGCATGQQEIDGDFFVVPLPTVSFTATPQTCNNKIYDFKDLSTETNNTITQWFWDFGDGNTSTLQNPTHTYASTGTFKVNFTVTTSSGCQSSSSSTITIVQQYFLGFTNTIPDCTSRTIIFTDTSKTSGFTTATRRWFFGDGDSSIVNNGALVQHTYKKAGTYSVKLVLTGTNGCTTDTLTKSIPVYPSPIAAFKIPGVCIADSLAYFFDRSKMADSSAVNLTYQWNFGDTNNPGTNTSGLQNPTHRYTRADVYTATLKVTSPAGCTDSTATTFVVNGATPVAGFNIANAGPVCSGQPVIVNNTSTVNFGIVTRIVYYFDSVNKPGVKVVIDTPKAGVPYIYTYPAFHLPQDTTTYIIKQVAYSGGTCVDSVTHPVTILPLPKVQFNAISNTCQLTPPFQLSQATETTGIPGTGTYSGTGVSVSGLFNPATAGVGTYVIKYKFTSKAGCADSLSQTITVLANPIVSTGNNVYVLLGKSIVLKPTAAGTGTGSSLTYQWLPATGLNKTNILNPTATLTDNITYTLTVSNGICQTQDTLHVTVLKPPIIPNTFTPNGDGVNDTWYIKYLKDYPGAVIQVFNRYGQQVFNSIGYSKPWDGTYNGQPVPVGTYYYKIDPKNGEQMFAGYVAVIR